MEVLEPIAPDQPLQSEEPIPNPETKNVKKPKSIPRAAPISPTMLSMLAELYHKHFAAYCSSMKGFEFIAFITLI
jgi:hypothetical protein